MYSNIYNQHGIITPAGPYQVTKWYQVNTLPQIRTKSLGHKLHGAKQVKFAQQVAASTACAEHMATCLYMRVPRGMQSCPISGETVVR